MQFVPHLDVAFVPFKASFGPLEAVSTGRGPAEADDLLAAATAGLLAGAIELEALAVGVDGALRPRPFFSDAALCGPPFLTSLGGGGPMRFAGAVAVRRGAASARLPPLPVPRGVVVPPFTF